jgi:hypothetical protein
MNEQPLWMRQAKNLLDESARNLDAAALSRLNRARQRALAQRRKTARWVLPTGLASACALLLAVAVWHARMPHMPVDSSATPTGDAALGDALADDDEFYENLDFYAWLDAQEQGPQG